MAEGLESAANYEPLLKRKKKLEEADMDITPMIDMTFLLLIFFMVSSKIATKAGVELPKARHGTVVNVKHTIQLSVQSHEPFCKVYKGDAIDEAQLIPGASLEEQEDNITKFVRETAETEQKKYVLIQAEKGVKHREVSRVSRAAARAELEKLYLGVLEKQ
jgi:biopolymer transport protein TolR